MTDTSPTPAVERVDDRHRYEIRVGGRRAGLTAYRDHGGQRVFFHTEIDGAYAGRGLASRLIRAALDDARASGLRIVPMCPFVAAFLSKHDDYEAVTDPVTPQVLEWLDTELRRTPGRS
ncbi:GNAT family N-acetyltransferase [Streptomyces rubradiris]|uniref:GNAT family N-acetyltransferase n=1 Tax=Streptomyces rubradiris TaxID=285531 RepID=UPI0033DBAE40